MESPEGGLKSEGKKERVLRELDENPLLGEVEKALAYKYFFSMEENNGERREART